MDRRLGLLTGAWVATLALATPALGSPGDLDPAFGQGGIAEPPYTDETKPIAAQPDGSIITLQLSAPFSRAALGRTSADGTADTAFGQGGSAEIPIPPGGPQEVLGLAVSSAGDIAALGAVTQYQQQRQDGYVAHFTADGALDTSFGSGGTAVIDLGGLERVLSGAFASDGSLIAVGAQYSSPGSPSGTFIARLRPDGSLDPAFGAGGVVMDVTGDGNEVPDAVSVLPDGRIEALLTSIPSVAPFVSQTKVAMLKPDGQLDPSFAGDGVAEIDEPLASGAGSARTASGATYVFGPRNVANSVTEIVLRLDAAGQLDPTFGDGGSLELATTAAGGVIDGSGRLVLVGRNPNVASSPFTDSDIELRRLNADGSPDQSFGDGGVVRTDVGQFGSTDSPGKVLADAQGHILVMARAYSARSRGSMKLLRYLTGDGPDDKDADGHLDPVDACPSRYDLNSADGCPTWPLRGLDIAYDRKIDDFMGKVSYEPVDTCTKQATVSVFRARPGRDRRVGRSGPIGDAIDPVTGAPAYEWSVSALAPAGRYYALVKPHMIVGFGECGGFKSARLRIRAHRAP